VERRTYRVTVRGGMSPRFATEFGGMSAESADGATTLVGELADQAQLYGLLERIRDFGLELTRVEMDEATP
jgi:hypothetical protein